MRRATIPLIAVIAVCLGLSGCMSTQVYRTWDDGNGASQLSSTKAKKILREKLKAWVPSGSGIPVAFKRMSFEKGFIHIYGEYAGSTYRVTCKLEHSYGVSVYENPEGTHSLEGPFTWDTNASIFADTKPNYECRPKFMTLADARAFADAWQAVSTAARRGENPLAEIEPQLIQFRADAPVYQRMIAQELPEEARKHRILAEAAFREKRMDDAAGEYTVALQFAPWWSAGRYNRALLLGETEDYVEAIIEMKKFLILDPNGKDARGAQDKIYVWEAKVAQN